MRSIKQKTHFTFNDFLGIKTLQTHRNTLGRNSFCSAQDDEFTVKVAETKWEAIELLSRLHIHRQYPWLRNVQEAKIKTAITYDEKIASITLCESYDNILKCRGYRTVPKQNDLEQKVLHLIMDKGDKGILQSDLWREMKVSSREGSRISIKLENKGLILRERELYNGRWTYRLCSKRQPVSIESIITCPCLICQVSVRCGSEGRTSPNECSKLTEWILKVGQKETDVSGGS